MRIRPQTILLMMLAGWVNRHQQDVIEYLKTENKILREKLGRKRILLNDEQRKKLAVLGKRLGIVTDMCVEGQEALWHYFGVTPRTGLGAKQGGCFGW